MSALHPRTPAQRTGLWLGDSACSRCCWLLPAPEGFARTGVAHGRARRADGGVVVDRGTADPGHRACCRSRRGPLLGIVPVERAGHGYGSSTIYLILGGCLLALALERWQLHRRIAYIRRGCARARAPGAWCSA
ncbi:MAG: anion permease [Comamonadaceae bacterium]|nr:anion permease [Comamonadaceae bacterium]